MARLRKDFLQGALASDLIVNATQITASSMSALPVITLASGDIMAITLDPDGTAGPPEIVHVVSHAANSTVVTVLRGREGTTAREHLANTIWRNATTAEDLYNPSNVPAWIRDLHTPLGDGPEGMPVYSNNFNDEPMGTYVTSSGTAFWTQRKGVMSVRGAGQAGGSCAAILYPYAVPVGYVVESRVTTVGPNTNYWMAGPILTDGLLTTSKSCWMTPYAHTAVAQKRMALRSGTVGLHTATITMSEYDLHYGAASSLYLRIHHVSANTWNCAVSSDSVSWRMHTNAAYTFTPTHIGLGVSTWGNAAENIATFDYLRVYPIV